MEHSDKHGYEAIRLNYTLLKQAINPSDVVDLCFEKGLISQSQMQEVDAAKENKGAALACDKLLDSVMGNGSEGAFQTFLNVLESKPNLEYLADLLRDSYAHSQSSLTFLQDTDIVPHDTASDCVKPSLVPRAQPLNPLDDEVITLFMIATDKETGKAILEDVPQPPPDTWDAGCPLLDACARGDHEQVLRLLSRKNELNRTDPSGKTPLHYACQFGWNDVVRILIQESLDPNSIDVEGNSSLHIACQYGNSEIVDLILPLYTCDVNAINDVGNTPLHLACQIGSTTIAMKLMATGKVNYGIKNKQGLTALEVADESSQIRDILSSSIQKMEVPFAPISRVYLLGSNSSGKSTLINGLRVRLGMDNMKEAPKVFKRNQGIVPFSFRSQKFLHPFLVCKFPGNRDFYMNEMPKYVSYPPQLFIIVVDISQPDEEVKKDVKFWTAQIDKHFSSNSSNVVIIASHLENMEPTTLKRRLNMFPSHHLLPMRLLDVSTHEYQQLLIKLSQCKTHQMPKNQLVATLGSLIDETFGSSEALDLMDVVSYIKSNDDVPLPQSKEDLSWLASSLSRHSDIIHLSTPNGQSWIVVNISKYLETLLASGTSPAPVDVAASFLFHLGFHSDAKPLQSEEVESPSGMRFQSPLPTTDIASWKLEGYEEAISERLTKYKEERDSGSSVAALDEGKSKSTDMDDSSLQSQKVSPSPNKEAYIPYLKGAPTCDGRGSSDTLLSHDQSQNISPVSPSAGSGDTEETGVPVSGSTGIDLPSAQSHEATPSSPKSGPADLRAILTSKPLHPMNGATLSAIPESVSTGTDLASTQSQTVSPLPLPEASAAGQRATPSDQPQPVIEAPPFEFQGSDVKVSTGIDMPSSQSNQYLLPSDPETKSEPTATPPTPPLQTMTGPSLQDPISVEVVQAKIQELEDRFKALKISTWECLESHNVSMKAVMKCVADLPADDLPEHKVFMESALHILFQAEDHIELFGSMNFYWNYLSYHLLEYLANKFSLDEVSTEIEEYKRDLQLFMQETPANVFSQTQTKKIEPPPGFRKLVVQHEWPENVTLMAVEEFRQQFVRQYNLHDCALIFATIQKGSFTVVWFISECVAQRVDVNVGEELTSQFNITRLETAGVSVFLNEESQKIVTISVSTSDGSSNDHLIHVQNGTEDVADEQETAIILKEKESEIRVLKEHLAMKEKRLQDSIQNLAEKEMSIQANEDKICSLVKKKPLQNEDETQLNTTEKDAELCSVKRDIADVQELLAKFQESLLEKEKEMDMLQQRPSGSAPRAINISSMQPHTQPSSADSLPRKEAHLMRLKCHKRVIGPGHAMKRGAAVAYFNSVYFVLKSSRDVYGYLLDRHEWRVYPQCPYYYTGLAVISNSLTAVGGSESDPMLNHHEAYGRKAYQKTSKLHCLINKQWEQVFPPMNIARCGHAVISDNRCVIAAGGVDESSVEIFTIGSNTWSILSSRLPQDFHSITATLCDDHIYVMDCTGRLYAYSSPIHSILSNLATSTRTEESSQHTWRPLPKAPNALVESTLSTMCGQLVMVGGHTEYRYPATVHIRQLYKGEWVTIGHMTMARCEPIVAVLPRNRMIIVGGNSVELAVLC